LLEKLLIVFLSLKTLNVRPMLTSLQNNRDKQHKQVVAESRPGLDAEVIEDIDIKIKN
jgi:hypothetical protein